MAWLFERTLRRCHFVRRLSFLGGYPSGQRKQQRGCRACSSGFEQVQCRISPSIIACNILPSPLPATPSIRFLAVARSFPLGLDEEVAPGPSKTRSAGTLQKWLAADGLADLVDQATVDWAPPKVLLDTLGWRWPNALTQCVLPQPAATIRRSRDSAVAMPATLQGKALCFRQEVLAAGDREKEQRLLVGGHPGGMPEQRIRAFVHGRST